MKIKNSFLFSLPELENCSTESIINSPILSQVIEEYIDALVPVSRLKNYFEKRFKSAHNFHSFLISAESSSLELLSIKYPFIAEEKASVLQLIDGVYDTWRKVERYAICENCAADAHYLIAVINAFSSQIITIYRTIYEKILQSSQRVYRELASGVNAGLLLKEANLNLPPELRFLSSIKPISSVVVKPPFIVQTFSNKRSGLFSALQLDLTTRNIDVGSFYLLPLLVNHLLCVCYIHRDYLSILMGLGTLFEVADKTQLEELVPSMIMVYGVDEEFEPGFIDRGDHLIGIIPHKTAMDYFGYAKKMILTLYNIRKIKDKALPIHGAGIKVILKDRTEKNIAILGDSGAGKSETIEALLRLHDPRIADIITIFDDMGTFFKENQSIYMSGTETGAFVRLDDLDKSYSLKSIDRAIFYNPEKTNSRVVIPITDYQTTCKKHPVDIFLYADNYTDNGLGLEVFSDAKEIIKIFEQGSRVAMKTTAETGLVSTFFANPFGPVQFKNECHVLIEDFITCLSQEHKTLGVLYTLLSREREKGVNKASVELLNLIANNN